jgi:hypothetical protein
MRRCETLSPLGTSPLQYQPAILACHSGAKAVRLGSTPVVWLKSWLGHLFRSPSCAKTVRLTAAVAYVKKGKKVPQAPGKGLIHEKPGLMILLARHFSESITSKNLSSVKNFLRSVHDKALRFFSLLLFLFSTRLFYAGWPA